MDKWIVAAAKVAAEQGYGREDALRVYFAATHRKDCDDA